MEFAAGRWGGSTFHTISGRGLVCGEPGALASNRCSASLILYNLSSYIDRKMSDGPQRNP